MIVTSRSRAVQSSTRQTSVRLDSSLFLEMVKCIEARSISQRAFLEQAIRRELAEQRRVELASAYEEAFTDAEYVSEMEALAETAVSDGLE